MAYYDSASDRRLEMSVLTLSKRRLRDMVGVFALLGPALFLFAPALTLAQTEPCPLEFCTEGDCVLAEVSCQETSQGQRKWNPGFYMQLLRNSQNLEQSTRFKQYDEIGSNEELIGVMVPWRWAQLEGDKQGDYSAGVAEVRKDIEKLKSLPIPKRFIMKIIDFDYGGDRRESSYFPAYLRAAGLTYQGTNGVGFCRWNNTAAGSYIQMIEAYAKAFEDEPFFEAIIIYKETAPALGGSRPCGYSPAAYVAQTERVLNAAVAAFPNTNVVLAHNYFIDQAASSKLVEFMANNSVAIGGPDVLPSRCTNNANGTWAYQAFRGDLGGTDYRGSIASIWSVENSEMGLGLGDCTPQEFVEFASESLHATHLGIDRNTFAGGPENQWPAILDYISRPENALKHTDCPATYLGRCQ